MCTSMSWSRFFWPRQHSNKPSSLRIQPQNTQSTPGIAMNTDYGKWDGTFVRQCECDRTFSIELALPICNNYQARKTTHYLDTITPKLPYSTFSKTVFLRSHDLNVLFKHKPMISTLRTAEQLPVHLQGFFVEALLERKFRFSVRFHGGLIATKSPFAICRRNRSVKSQEET